MKIVEIRLIDIPSLAAGASEQCKVLGCERIRRLTITARCTYNASASGVVTLYFYFLAPDGDRDTIAYSTLALTLSAGNTVQRTAEVTCPEDGEMILVVTNADSTYAATRVKIYATLQRWSKEVTE